MEKVTYFIKSIVFLGLISFSSIFQAQNDTIVKPKTAFLEKVRIGGGLGLNFGSGYTNFTLAPSAIYDVNKYVSVGAGIQGSYINYRGNSESFLYGGSIIGLFNPVEFLQASVELEQLRANVNYERVGIANDNFWNTALFVGAGYRMGYGAIGVRYNLLNNSQNIYVDPWMPFVRVYF